MISKISQDLKPVLMIHEVYPSIFDLDLENYTLTFDDGLYSQYYYFNQFQRIPTEKIYFISSGIICNGEQSVNFPKCSVAHQKAFNGNFEDYMTIEQINELGQDPMVTIGGHSHSHKRLSTTDKLTEKIKHFSKDTKCMLSWFNENLGLKPNKFCYPYNEDHTGLYTAILKQYGFTDFYGRERIPVETLLRT